MLLIFYLKYPNLRLDEKCKQEFSSFGTDLYLYSSLDFEWSILTYEYADKNNWQSMIPEPVVQENVRF